MKLARKHWLPLLALVFALSIVLSVGIISASAAEVNAPSFELLDGASARLDAEHPGLRFETRILTSELNTLGGAEIGTLILPTDKLSGDLTLDTTGALKIVCEKSFTKGDYTHFYAAIIDILPKNYARSFTAVSYVKVGEDVKYSKPTARSIFEVAFEACENGYSSNAIIKEYLDKVVFLSGCFNVMTPEGYTSSYTASRVKDGSSRLLRIAKKDGASADLSQISAIIIDGNVYTDQSNWTVTGDTLSVPYSSFVSYINFDGYKHAYAGNVAGADVSMTVDNILKFSSEDTGTTRIDAQDENGNSLNYIRFTMSGYDNASGRVILQANAAGSYFAGKNSTKMTITMSLMIPANYEHAACGAIALRRDALDTRVDILKLDAANNAVILPGGAKVGDLEAGTFHDFSFTVDIEEAKIYGYCDGKLTAVESISVPAADAANYATFDEWARQLNYLFDGYGFNNSLEGATEPAGICFDNVFVDFHK